MYGCLVRVDNIKVQNFGGLKSRLESLKKKDERQHGLI